MGLAVTCRLVSETKSGRNRNQLPCDGRRLGDHSDVNLTKQYPAPSPFLSILARFYLFESIASSLCWVSFRIVVDVLSGHSHNFSQVAWT